VLLTPVTAEAVAAVVSGGAPPAEVGACDPRRFGSGTASEAPPRPPRPVPAGPVARSR
jgi:hypothetical protein